MPVTRYAVYATPGRNLIVKLVLISIDAWLYALSSSYDLLKMLARVVFFSCEGADHLELAMRCCDDVVLAVHSQYVDIQRGHLHVPLDPHVVRVEVLGRNNISTKPM